MVTLTKAPAYSSAKKTNRIKSFFDYVTKTDKTASASKDKNA